ncbi:MAG: GNAT family N-acetyltransferase [Chromatiales bacterium]
MVDSEEVEIVPISLEELRADKSGVLVEQMAALAYHSFREPPWSDRTEKPRLHLGLGVDLMRCNALAFAAKTKLSGKLVGYILGYEVFQESGDPRDLTLYKISGTKALDYLFEGGKRVFYGDTLCVDPGFRRRHIAYKLSASLISGLRAQGFAYRIGRTDIIAGGMRALFAKLGFQELSAHDTSYPERTYWLLRL